MKKKYFTKVGTSYQISDEIKRCVQFKQHNLLKDPYPKDCDLIVCRNVVIYFTDEAKDEIYRKFYDSLKKGGVLFIGSTEQIMNYKEMGFERKSSFFFGKQCLLGNKPLIGTNLQGDGQYICAEGRQKNKNPL